MGSLISLNKYNERLMEIEKLKNKQKIPDNKSIIKKKRFQKLYLNKFAYFIIFNKSYCSKYVF